MLEILVDKMMINIEIHYIS